MRSNKIKKMEFSKKSLKRFFKFIWKKGYESGHDDSTYSEYEGSSFNYEPGEKYDLKKLVKEFLES